jgi:hypothetical protein
MASVLLASVGAGAAWALSVSCAADPVALCVGANSADDSLRGEVEGISGGIGADTIAGEVDNSDCAAPA